jgi:hypothetical protein
VLSGTSPDYSTLLCGCLPGFQREAKLLLNGIEDIGETTCGISPLNISFRISPSASISARWSTCLKNRARFAVR